MMYPRVYTCLICKKAGSSNFLFKVGCHLSRHFSLTHIDCVGDRTKFIKPYRPKSFEIKIEMLEEKKDEEVDSSDDEEASSGDWNLVSYFLNKKIATDRENKRQLARQNDRIHSLETELGNVRHLLETREAEKSALQVQLRNLQNEGQRREIESRERLRHLESTFVEATMKQQQAQKDLKDDLDRANARCKRKGERNAYLQKENENLKKRLKTVADNIN